MNTIYIANINIVRNEESYKKACDVLPEERVRKASLFVRENDRLRCITAGLLVKRGLFEANIPESESETAYTEHKKPFLKEHPELHINISHSGDYAVAAFSDEEVGIDIEKIRNVTPSLMRYTLDEREFASLEDLSGDRLEKAFFKYWTAKESFVKYLGIGLTVRPAEINSTYAEELSHVNFYHFDTLAGYSLTVCSPLTKPNLVQLEPKFFI